MATLLRQSHKQHIFLLSVMLALCACGARPAAAPALPTADVRRANASAARVSSTPIAASTTPAPTPTAIQPPAPTPHAPQPSLGAPLDQYRAWMEEARVAHPYDEAVDMMWDVMICESSGQAGEVAGSYAGLFQYDDATWSGDWNPYRASSILDARAQIFATAKAWHDGNQHWWGCYGG